MEMIKEKRVVTTEMMVDYYFDVLTHAKKQTHKEYAIAMIAFYNGKKYPNKKITETLI